MRWLRGVDSETELVSGSSDGDAIIWNLRDGVDPVVLRGHSGNVNIVDGLYCGRDQEHTVVVSASMDSSIKIWWRSRLNG